MQQLQKLIEDADRAVTGDAYVWGDPDGEMYGVGQDSEQAEESGRLIGYLEGLRAAAELIGDVPDAQIQEIVDYNWVDEAADYEQWSAEVADAADRAAHIFTSLQAVQTWLDKRKEMES